MKTIFIPALFAAMLFFGFNGCSKKEKYEIVGKWLVYEEAAGEEYPDGYYEYFEDGTWKMDPPDVVTHTPAREGRWSMLDEDRIRIEFTLDGERYDRVCVIKHDGKDLLISNNDVPFNSRHVRIE